MAKPVKQPVPKGKQKIFGRSLIIGLIIGGVVMLALVVVVGMPLAIAHRQDLPLERVYGDMAVKVAVQTQAGSDQNPLAQNPRALQVGQVTYVGSCAVCHGATGDGKGVFGSSMYPPATELISSRTQSKSDAQLFWIIKNGLSFLGMPAFGAQYNDQEIWALVTYTRSFAKAPAGGGAFKPAAPTSEQLAMADPHGTPEQRGAAVYFAQGCNLCHGVGGNSPGAVHLGGGREAPEAVREGRLGMPIYSSSLISDGEMSDLVAYLSTFRRGRG